ncbi:chromatin accessibility complex protein 1 isoform X1 [Sylvia atricapilla]|uniref:chromatin accessibility complex protein 1 isoform X1 n=1 Tax=Sylvia atricapilla TaxID=48155 RepID=UPI0033908F8E
MAAPRLSGTENRLVSLPLSRIRVIMKSSPEVSSINQDALFLTAKATELFVQYLATYSYKHGRGKEKNALTYTDLSHTAEECETFQFLAEVSCGMMNIVCEFLSPEECAHPSGFIYPESSMGTSELPKFATALSKALHLPKLVAINPVKGYLFSPRA